MFGRPWIHVRPHSRIFCKQSRRDSIEGVQALDIHESYGCLSFVHGKTSCDFSDDRNIVQAVRNVSGIIVPYIVGFIDTNIACEFNKPLIFFRTAYDIDWIKNNIN